ncbi:MAG: vitamin B12-dependent ribonucleotide reductase [SAR202 cluster bacterium]|nr:vitamin B12-dependent ribonucleotide reductase [SAR202 cluster bacterium]
MSGKSIKANNGFHPAELSENSVVVLKKRYLRKNDRGETVEDPQGMFKRVAQALAAIERQYGTPPREVEAIAGKFYRSMASLEFVPNSPTLMNAGTGAGTLSACFVLPLYDSMTSIMGCATDAAMVQKFGGGTGFALSHIRPKGTAIKTTHGRACGPIAVLRHLSSVSTLVTQGGKRDGANMAVMDVHHPDILEFIDCKQVEGQIHNFNISVGVTDEFMKAVEDGTDYALRFRSNPADPKSKPVEVGRIDARQVFNKIVEGAWRNGEPGMIFLDEVNRNSPVLHVGRIEATNPCGEQPLLPNESCNLGSINMARFLVDTKDGKELDWQKLGETVRLSVRFLDNVIDANGYAVPEIEKMTKFTRKIGLGVMGFADMLVEMGIPYDSDEGVEMGRRVMKFIQEESDRASNDLAAVRGPFPAFEGSRYQKEGHKPIRNACRLTVAPTGTISMIAGCSSGIEPIFSLVFRKHNILEGQTLFYIDRNFERIARERGFYSEELMAFLADGGSLQARDDVPEDVRRLFHVASDISPRYHVLMQAAFQASTDAGISKTINFPNSATIKDVEESYLLAWRTGCKGITVYRAGSREKEVLTAGTTEKKKPEAATVAAEEPAKVEGHKYLTPKDRPSEVHGVTRRIRTGHGNVFVTVNINGGGRPFEVFATLGKAGGCDAAQHEAIGRLVSLALRSGLDPDEVVKQLRGITCCPTWDDGVLVRSGPDAIALALQRQLEASRESEAKAIEPRRESAQLGMFKGERRVLDVSGARPVAEFVKSPTVNIMAQLNQRTCPDCGAPSLAFEEGCMKCYTCGYSKC